MMSLFFALIIVLLSGYLAVSVIDRDLELRFRILFAIPFGFAIHSLFYFLLQCLNIYSLSDFRFFEMIFVLILALIYYNQERPDLSKHKFKRLNNWFYLANIYALVIFLKYFINNPMGSWDGFRIWNIKAEFLYLQSPLWKNLFNLPHFMSHGDYPLFLPCSTARLWLYSSHQDFTANILIGFLFTFGLIYLLYQALRYFKSEKVAYAVCTVFMLCDIFLVNGAAQCADIPLAMFFLSSVVCLFLYFKNNRFNTLLLGLIFAGLSVWVKNEGLMFFAIYAAVIFGWFLRNKDYKKSIFTAVLAGITIFFAILFKKFSAAPNDLIFGFNETKSYVFAFDINRYIVIAKTFITLLFKKFFIFLALVLLCFKGFKIREKIRQPFLLSSLIFGLTVCGYVAVYVLAPHDINWLVENSMDRIILQILPVFLFLFSITLRIGKPDSIN